MPSLAEVAPFSVIRLPYAFGHEKPIPKLFVVIGHVAEIAFCLKTTSQTEAYDNNPARKQGCVCYEGGLIGCFPLKTYVETDNQFPIEHREIIKYQRAGTFFEYPARRVRESSL